jgi:hypothetical protein
MEDPETLDNDLQSRGEIFNTQSWLGASKEHCPSLHRSRSSFLKMLSFLEMWER